MRLFTFCLALALLICFSLIAQPARAENFLVNWGGDYLGMEASGQLLDLGPETTIADAAGNMTGIGFAYDEDTPKSPASNRYNLKNPSAVFYGVLQVMNPAVPESGDPARLIRSFSQVKALNYKNAVGFGGPTASNGKPPEITGMVFWRKHDFLKGADSKISWSGIDLMNVSITGITHKGGEGSVRFAIRNGDKWYLSEIEQKKGGPFGLSDSKWGEWKGLGAGFPLPEVPKKFPQSANEFTDITAVGVFFRSRSDTEGINSVFSFNSFQVECRP